MVVNPLCCHATESKSESETGSEQYYLFVVGDSLYDPGNNALFVPEFVPGNCPFGFNYFNRPTGRVSDGRILPDFIATKMNLPFIPPIMDENADFSHGASFASAGSGVFDKYPDCINLPDQYIKFTNFTKKWRKDLGDEEAEQRLNRAIYLISIGGNDYYTYSDSNPNANIREMQGYVDQVIANLQFVLKGMYDQGARKFMLQNVSPAGCIPMTQEKFNITDGCAQIPLTLAALHNAALYPVAESIKSSPGYHDFTYSIFDFYTLLGQKIRDPDLRGDEQCFNKLTYPAPLPNGYNCTDSFGTNYRFNGSVCSAEEAKSFVFFDFGHNTDALNHDFSEILWNGGQDVVYPYNMKQLLEYEIPTSHLKMTI